MRAAGQTRAIHRQHLRLRDVRQQRPEHQQHLRQRAGPAAGAGSNPGSNNGSNGSTIAQLPDVNVDAEDPLPGYTPSSNFGNCAADNLDTAYEKVVDVTYNRGTVTELTTRRVLATLVK